MVMMGRDFIMGWVGLGVKNFGRGGESGNDLPLIEHRHPAKAGENLGDALGPIKGAVLHWDQNSPVMAEDAVHPLAGEEILREDCVLGVHCLMLLGLLGLGCDRRRGKGKLPIMLNFGKNARGG